MANVKFQKMMILTECYDSGDIEVTYYEYEVRI